MQFSRPSLYGLCVVLVASLMAPPVAAKPAKPKKSQETTVPEGASKSRLIDEDPPDVSDGSSTEALEPGEMEPGKRAPGAASRSGSGIGISTKRPNIGSDAVAAQFDAEASMRFDEGNYREAARLWVKALEALAENQSNHATRSAMLLNAITAYEQVFVETSDVEVLKRAQLVIGDYLRTCKKRYGSGCDRYTETADARKRLEDLLARIDQAQPKIKKIAPEIDTAPGGRPYDRMIKQPAAPAWIGPAFAAGVALAGGGAALTYWARTSDRFDPEPVDVAASTKISFRDMHDTGTTDPGTDDPGTDTGTDTGTTATPQTEALRPEIRGDLVTVAGVFMAAAGVGLVVLASIKLAKHRRINRERSAVLSVVPAVSPVGGGIGLHGRF